MVQELTTKPSIFGRLGKGLGQGLADQIPKEVEYQRLRSGLQSLAQKSGQLSPAEFLAEAAGTYGITPQMIQSFGEIAKQQNQQNAYSRRGTGQNASNPKSSPGVDDVDFINMQRQNQPMQPKGLDREENINQRRSQNVKPEEFNQPQIVNENPLDEKTLTRPPWTPEQRDDRIRQYINQGFLVDQAQALAADDEGRDLAEPKAYQQRFSELKEKQENARQALRRHLETKLQKTGEELFKDISGEMLINLERGMERDLRTNPKATFEDIANDWSNRALDLAKAKKQYDNLAATTGFESLFKGDQTLKKLREYQDIFKKAGNSEEYYNLLKKGASPESSGFGLSSQGAASIAYPRNKNIKNYVSKFKPVGSPSLPAQENKARKTASEMEHLITADDSLLAIARDLNQIDPYFDQQAFFDQLSEDKDVIRLNDRQRRELAEGTQDILPTWGDVLIFPLIRRPG